MKRVVGPTSSEGDILKIVISRRKGIPHAMIHRRGSEIRSRTYYIRSDKRKQLIDDVMLDYLFQSTTDPYLNIVTGLTVWYARKELIFFSDRVHKLYVLHVTLYTGHQK